MAYGVKYELFFSDVEIRKVKVEILEKDYVGLPSTETVYSLIGTGDPVQIEWDADDDIYSPIIGSRCKLSFYVTDQNTYEDFYRADERQFKVRFKYYEPAGNQWENERTEWDGAEVNWDSIIGDPIYYQSIWEGFLVVDRYQEVVTSTPYPIHLEAVDGLGTLDGFDMPLDQDDNESTENLFYFLKEILLLTGHEFPIYIANSIRKVGATANDTIFHDIIVDKYALFNENLTLKTAKEVLELILRTANSRIFQSYSRWYIVNNSSLIDNRIDINQEIVDSGAGSGEDDTDEPDVVIPGETADSPNITLAVNGYLTTSPAQVYVGQNIALSVTNIGSTAVSYRFDLPDATSVTQTVAALGAQANKYTFTTSAELSMDSDTFTVVATDAQGDTDTDSITIAVASPVIPDNSDLGEPESEPTPTEAVYFSLTFFVSGSVGNAYSNWGTYEEIIYSAHEVGNAFSIPLRFFANSGEFTAASNVSASVTGGYSLTKILDGDTILITISGTLPAGGGQETVSVSGSADSRHFSSQFNLTTNVSNAQAVPSPSNLFRKGKAGNSFSMSITYTPNSGYTFVNSGNIQIRTSNVVFDSGNYSISSHVSGGVLTVTISGNHSTFRDQSGDISITGAAVYNAGATSISTNPDGRFDFSSGGGYFPVTITSDGGFTVSSNRSWLRASISSGTPSTGSMLIFVDRSGKKNRSGSISFTPQGSASAIHTITIDQESNLEAQ